MVTASLKTSKSSDTSVKCSYWVQLCAGCSHMLLVYMGQVWPTTASTHQPLFASVNQGWVYSTSGRSQMKHESETWVMTTETLNGLWHTKWHDPLDLLHQH